MNIEGNKESIHESEVVKRLDRFFTSNLPTPSDEWNPRIEGYQILRPLAEGTFGRVYEAAETTTSNTVAIKVAKTVVSQSPDLRNRFFRECNLNQKLNHPGIVPTLRFGETSYGQLYLVMPFCEGKPLSNWLSEQSSRPDWRVVVSIMEQVAMAIHHGHSHGVIHRDLKPSNILLELRDGIPVCRVLDFGLAYGIDDSMAQTSSSVLIGTPLYMAPEQIDSRLGPISAMTDVFAMGSLLYECLVKVQPFLADRIPSVLENIRRCEPQRLSSIRDDLPRDLQTILNRCLRVSPHHRYQSALDLAADLASVAKGSSITAKPLTWWQSVDEWMKYPSRVREAGLGLIVLNAIVLAWAILNYPLAILFNPDGIFHPDVANPLFLPLVAFIVPVHGYLLYSSICLSRERLTKSSQWFHFYLTLAMAVGSILGVCYLPTAYTPNVDRFERLAALGLMSSFGELQCLLILLVAVFRK